MSSSKSWPRVNRHSRWYTSMFSQCKLTECYGNVYQHWPMFSQCKQVCDWVLWKCMSQCGWEEFTFCRVICQSNYWLFRILMFSCTWCVHICEYVLVKQENANHGVESCYLGFVYLLLKFLVVKILAWILFDILLLWCLLDCIVNMLYNLDECL